MPEIMRWISLGISLFALCIAVYTNLVIVRRNKQLWEENQNLKAKYLMATMEIVRLQNQLKFKEKEV